MAWLLRRAEVLASLEVARGPVAALGVVGQLAPSAPVRLYRATRLAHSFGCAQAVEVAQLDGEWRVLKTSTLAPRRLLVTRRDAAAVIAAPEGAFERWGLQVGDHLEVEP